MGEVFNLGGQRKIVRNACLFSRVILFFLTYKRPHGAPARFRKINPLPYKSIKMGFHFPFFGGKAFSFSDKSTTRSVGRGMDSFPVERVRELEPCLSLSLFWISSFFRFEGALFHRRVQFILYGVP